METVKGVIEHVQERTNALSRAVRTHGKRGVGQAEREHVLIANVDQACLVFAVAQPTPNFRMLDRLLVSAERAEIEHVVIIANKIDLDLAEKVNARFEAYINMGYDILHTSTVTSSGIDALRERLAGRVSVFAGPSGVGKTSLLNAIQPDLGRMVKAVSDYSQEGIHTTRDSALIKLQQGGYIADTPGIRQLNLWDVEPDELDGYFRDIADFVDMCRFSNCTHTNEPHCAVRTAVEDGEIRLHRYENYLHLRDELIRTYIIYQR